MIFLFSQIWFFLSIFLLIFLPGFFLLYIFRKIRESLSLLEIFVLSFGLGVIILDFLMIIISRLGFSLNSFSIFSSIFLFCSICFFITKILPSYKKENSATSQLFQFSKNQTILIFLVLTLTIFIKTVYLSSAIFPTSTDLGHHMYWSQLITSTGSLPIYQERDIIQDNDTYSISELTPIDDFIIGEHLIFAALTLVTGLPIISSLPSLFLLLVNLMGILTIFILSIHLFKGIKIDQFLTSQSFSLNYFSQNAGIMVLFLIGPLYALASPQAKYISGGVVGNLFGNLFIPLILYFLYRALTEKKPSFLSLSIIAFFGLAFTHHLSTLLFIFIFLFIIFSFSILHILKKDFINNLFLWLKLFFTPTVLFLLFFLLLFTFFVYTPSYLNFESANTAIGKPSKDTRTGISLSQFIFSNGEARTFFGILGFFALLFLKPLRYGYGPAFLIGWFFSLTLASLAPQLLFLDIPSDRISNYALFPFTILAGFFLIFFISFLYNHLMEKKYSFFLPLPLIFSSLCLIFIFITVSGFYDNNQTLSRSSNISAANQTYHASYYLKTQITKDDIILKDHNYITADSWIKLFFVRDYNFPFSRSYFQRYDDPVKPREQCTLNMISLPNTSIGKKCFSEIGVNYIMIHPNYDSTQFEKSRQFSKIYQNDTIAIYKRLH